ncbi:MAG: hypothetical protein ACC655_07695, partial [Rhodothermia bacterium]
ADSRNVSCEVCEDLPSGVAGSEQSGAVRETPEEASESLRFERLLSEISARFVSVSSDRVDAEIGKALRALLEFFDLDRCIFLKDSREGGVRLMHPDHLVCAPASSPCRKTSTSRHCTLGWPNNCGLTES